MCATGECSTCSVLAEFDVEPVRYPTPEQRGAAEAKVIAADSRREATETIRVVADGLRVLRTRDGVPLTEEQIMERARNIATGLMCVRLDGVRFDVRRAPTEQDFAQETRIK